jgi:RHS repeat-associated protein
MLTGSAGTSEATMTYDPYGNTVGTTGTAKTPLEYDAQYTSSDTGLIYLRARVYDPATAQFLTVDPLVETTRAPYNYADDNSVNNADPTGRESITEAYEHGPCLGCVTTTGKEALESGIESAAHSAENLWNKINENEGPNDEGAQELDNNEAARDNACDISEGHAWEKHGAEFPGVDTESSVNESKK